MKRESDFDYALWEGLLGNDVGYCLSAESGVSLVADLNLSDELLEKVSSSLLIKTSGSSGVAKWVVHSKNAILKHAALVNVYLDISENDVFGLALPSYHVGGLGVIARAHVSGARVAVYSDKWSAGSCVAFLNENKVSVLSLVPTQLVDIVNGVHTCPKSVRAVVIGGGRLDPDVRAEALKLGWSILESYGMTETGSQIATGSFGKTGHLDLIGGWQVRTDREGLLEVKGDCLLEGYLLEGADGDDRWQFVDPKVGGWFTTSDRVDVLELDGRTGIKFIGRSDQRVKILGELVDVTSLESRLSLLIRDEVYLVPLLDDRRGVKLYPVVDKMENSDLIRDLSWSGLEQLEESIVVSHFPRNEMGKLRRSKLTEVVESIVFSAR